jgi:glycosyltransferase involved in cell wall biosynthesis
VKVLHLVSFDRWSGAVGPAFSEVEALRSQGVEAFFAFVGGYKLERKLTGIPWAKPLLSRGHGPLAAWKSVRAIRNLIHSERIEVLHAHLSWDHQLARFAAQRGDVKLVRTYHARRSLRAHLISKTDGIAVVNEALLGAQLFAGRDVVWTPVPVDHRQFRPDGPRREFSRPLIGAIGKLDRDRGFEDVLRAAADIPGADLVIVGHGSHQGQLGALANELRIAGRVHFAGYHEETLPEFYRAMDVLLFAGEGSDEGHRAVSEAMACGVPVAAYPFPGMQGVVGEELASSFICGSADPRALAERASALLARADGLRAACVAATERFGFQPTAERLARLYARLAAR